MVVGETRFSTASGGGNALGLQQVGSSSLSYDADQRLTHITHRDGAGAVLADYGYVYDAASRLTSETDNGKTTPYNYDAVNELTADGPRNFSYDPNYNRTNPGYVTGADNRLQTDGTWNYFFDKGEIKRCQRN